LLLVNVQLFAENKKDSLRVESLLRNSESFLTVNADSSLTYATIALQLCEQNKLNSLLIKSKFLIGKNLQNKGKHQEALDVYIPLQLQLLQNDKKDTLELKLYTEIANCYRDLKKTVKALEYLFLVTSVLEKDVKSKANDYLLANVYTSIAISYGKSGRHEQAADFVKKNIEIYARHSDKSNLVKDYNNLGYTYFKLERYDEAQENLLKGYALNEQDGSINESLGELYQEIGQIEKALLHAAVAYNEARKSKRDGMIAFRKNLILTNIEVTEAKENLKENTQRANDSARKTIVSSSPEKEPQSEYLIYFIGLLILSNIIFLVLYFKK
jgi:tetratricopeptide (TPR) repeat protein